MALTAVAIKNAKGREKPYKITDSDGLFLYVTPNGGRYWRMNYRHLGKQKTLAFGVYPETGLAEAREQRDAARKILARGDDPAEQIKLDKVAAAVAASNSFKAVADEWLVKVEREGRSAVTMKKLRWLLDFINDSIGERPIASISAQELLVMLRKMESKGRYETAKRLRSTCSQIFRYAIATARAERDVATDLRGALIAPQPVHRAAITNANAAGGLLRAIEAFEGHPNTKAALRLLPHVFVRPGELRYAEWADLDFDKALWVIPKHKTKMRRIHSIPLSRQALAILETLEHDADYSSYLFPSLRSVDRPMSENTINAALRRMGFTVPAGGVGAIINYGPQNIASIAVRGLDVSAGYWWQTGLGRLSISGSLSRMFDYDTRSAAGAPAFAAVGNIGYSADPIGRQVTLALRMNF